MPINFWCLTVSLIIIINRITEPEINEIPNKNFNIIKSIFNFLFSITSFESFSSTLGRLLLTLV